MPAKKTQITDAERSKRLQEAAHRLGMNDDPEVLERAFKKIEPPKRPKPASHD
jgi:hypothetical protein